MDKKDTRLNVRMTEESKEIIKIRAIKKKMTISEYVMHCVMLDISNDEKKELEE